MAVAGHAGFADGLNRPLRVATKFPGIAREYYGRMGRQIDIIRLNGSIELAPVLGLSDVIVDIVETGKTLKENRLEVLSEIAPVSARLIAHRSAFRFKRERIEKIAADLNKVVEEKV